MIVNKIIKENGFKIETGKVEGLVNIGFTQIEGKNADSLYIFNNENDEIDDINISMHHIESLKDIKIISKTHTLKKTKTKVRNITINLGNGKSIDLTIFEEKK